MEAGTQSVLSCADTSAGNNRPSQRINKRGVLLLLPLLSMTILPSSAGIYSRSQSGQAIHWNRGTNIIFRANTKNQSQLPENTIQRIFTRALNRWKQTVFDGFLFTYYQGQNPAIYPTFLGSNADNDIFFTSQASAIDQLQCGTIALTTVWYQTTGTITKADLRFNDQCFRFTDRPSDTTIGSRNIYLQDVATHEFGHALGLDHSHSLQSTMVFTAWLQQSKPSCDDQATLQNLYAPQSRLNSVGAITGRVQSTSGSSVSGVQVEAIQLDQGRVLASALSDTSGRFTIPGLSPGKYVLTLSPFTPGPSSLSRFYGTINPYICSGQPFIKSFYLSPIEVTEGTSTDIGSSSVVCSKQELFSNPNIVDSSSSSSNASITLDPSRRPAVVVLGEPQGSSRIQLATFALTNTNLSTQISAVAYSLFSRINPTLELDSTNNLNRSPAAGGSLYDVFYDPTSGYRNYDASLRLNPSGNSGSTSVKLFAEPALDNTRFPSATTGLSSFQYALILASSAGDSSNPALYEPNARCEQPDRFPEYVVTGSPDPIPGISGDLPNTPPKGCGTITRYSDQGRSQSNHLEGLSSLLLDLFFLGAFALFRRLRLRKRSADSP